VTLGTGLKQLSSPSKLVEKQVNNYAASSSVIINLFFHKKNHSQAQLFNITIFKKIPQH